MDRKSFKIGDKVKLKPAYIRVFPQTIEVGKVVGFDEGYILVSYTNCIYREGFPYESNEIERVKRVGEQLLFSFMKG